MKKRLLSALLALALVFVLLPTTALAEVTTGDDYDISINGKGWKFERDNTSGAYIPAYYYHTNEFSADENYRKLYTNDNLMLTKEGNTVTITIRRGTSHDHGNYSPITFTLKKESTKINDVPCIEMGNDNNLVITGKGTLNITRNESKSYGAALYSNVGDITINGGITVNVSFLNGKDYYNKNATSNAIHVGNNHNLTVSGSGTNVTATNQGFDSLPATVCVEGGTITVSGGASLSATNTYADNFSGSSVTQHFKSYAISGTESKPCTLIVADEKSSVTAWAYDEKYGKPFGFVTYNITGATVKAGSDAYYATETTIDNINGKEYVKISVPALQRTSDVLIAGKNAVVGQWTNIPAAATGTGSYYYDADKKELTLKDVNITHSDGAIVQFMAGAPYIIKLEGTNSIKDVNSFIRVPERGYESLDGLSVTISGAGSLEVIARGNAITMLKGDLVFNNTGAITLETNTLNGKAINVSGNISIGNDFNRNLKITAGNDTFDLKYSDFNDLNKYKSISFATPNSTISYDGTTLKQGETIRNGGTATVDSKNNTITLNNFKGTQALSFEATLADSTLVLEGTNTLSSIVTTQKGLTISGPGSLTVGSIRVPNNTQNTANLTIIGGAHVTVNRPSGEDEPAVEVSGNLTVTGEGTQLSAECTAATNPAIEVGGNVTISGDPGTNAYTVKAYNKYAIQRGRDDKLRPSQMPSAFEISGNLSISGSAQVTAQTDSDGAAVWMPKQKVISVVDASLIAQNRSHNFSTISFGDESNMGNIYAKGQEVNIVAENMLGSNSSLAHRAIKAFIYNHYNTGDSNPYYIKVVSEGVQSGGNVNVIPGHCTSTGGYKVTITRGDAYTTPQVAANYTIAGQTMYVGKYYKTDTNGNITDGTAQDYNIYCDSANDFTLNNATISSTGTGGSTGVIMTNLNASSNEIHIKLIGKNSINNAGHHAILGEGAYSTIFIENAENASNASLTISGNYLPVYSYGNVTINAEVVIINTNGNLISTNKDGHANGAFDLGSGYKCYASASTTGNPLEEFNPANYSTYKYLRVTTLTLETGGGSTHQHVEGPWEADTQGGHHIKKCTECGEVMISEEHRYNYTYESPTTHKVNCGVCGVNFVRAHSYTNSYVPTEDGTQHHGKCICGAEETTLRDHVFVNGVCVCGVTQSGGDPTPDVPAAPTGLVGVAPTSENGNGKITGTTAQMEYASSLEGDWTTCANDSTDVPAGKYYVRMKKTDNTPAGEAVEVTVPAYSGTGEIVPPTPDNPGTIVIIRPAEEEKPAQQPNPSTGANDLVGLAVAAAVAAALGSAALLRKHD